MWLTPRLAFKNKVTVLWNLWNFEKISCSTVHFWFHPPWRQPGWFGWPSLSRTPGGCRTVPAPRCSVWAARRAEDWRPAARHRRSSGTGAGSHICCSAPLWCYGGEKRSRRESKKNRLLTNKSRAHWGTWCTPFYNFHIVVVLTHFCPLWPQPSTHSVRIEPANIHRHIASFSDWIITSTEARNHYSPIDSIGLHPGEPVLVDLQHELKASRHALDILRTLWQDRGRVFYCLTRASPKKNKKTSVDYNE